MYEFKFFADGIFLYRSVDLDAVAVDLDAVVNAIICFCGDTTIMIIIPAGTHPGAFTRVIILNEIV